MLELRGAIFMVSQAMVRAFSSRLQKTLSLRNILASLRVTTFRT